MKTDNDYKLNIQTLLSILTILVGGGLMIGKIIADGEPGAIPLLLIVSGIGWYFIIRNKNHFQSK